MQVKVEVEITKNRFGLTLGQASLTLDSDEVNPEGLAPFIAGIVNSAFARAKVKLEKQEAEPNTETELKPVSATDF